MTLINSLIKDDFPGVVVIVTRDVEAQEEITCNYNLNRGKRNCITVCRCTSSNCRLFIEQDAAKLMDTAIKATRNLNTQVIAAAVTNVVETVSFS
jgi:hypothetical protein